MALQEGQVQVRDLVMGIGEAGPATKYRVTSDFNPFLLSARSPGSGERAWGHGGWSGAEWAEPRVVPMTILIRDESNLTTAGWMEARHELAAAFRPIGDRVADVDMRFRLGGREYLLRGRPRMVEAETHNMAWGHEFARAAFVALDPLIYDGTETVTDPIGLPSWTGGLTLPYTLPFTIDATQVGGIATLVNEGTAETALHLRIDGPVIEPRVTVVLADGTVKTLRFDLELFSGQWLDVDTAAKSVLLNGEISRRGQTAGEWALLPSGTHTLKFAAGSGDTAELTARWRSAWW